MTAELIARNPVTNPTPAEVFKKAREHNITVMEARRVLIAANKVAAATVTIPTATRPIELPNFGLDPERNYRLIAKFPAMRPARLQDIFNTETATGG
ncbi:hypothetical protein [Arthrobacter sp. FW306-2-2C-D06B]|uniref:hypothetical protein n=1 Tax=Arthrobacter sp. FW306-2-2C-D06B TaxID=2879618 RepID=UPI001F480104|nr:hypothetical protein [Arthrobacter sp. FW306-2-2C-D06B]UKA59195.1 hypothetical protein LFT47_02225 [Arthrobacter sp. FW306-2-2C-D06B]